MSPWDALWLGLIQGATEFLPVSSSGHLVMAQTVLGISVQGVLFEVATHVATLVSVVVVYRARLAALAVGAVRGERDAWSYVGLLALATLPAAVVGILFEHRIEAMFEDPVVPGFSLLVTGAVLWSARRAVTRAAAERPAVVAALLIGCAQAFALIPGISRSGSTVVAALWLGVEAREAAAFSFLMAIPAIGGAALLQILALEPGSGPGSVPLLVGGVVAAVTGVLAIRTFVAMLARRSFHLFAPYCWAVASAYLVYLASR